MENFALFIPQFFTTEFMGCRILVEFKNKQKWETFKELGEFGQYKQLSLEGKPMGCWVDNMCRTFVTGAKDLQEWFDDYCKPIGSYGYDTYSSHPSLVDMFMGVVNDMNKAMKVILEDSESKIKKLLKEIPDPQNS